MVEEEKSTTLDMSVAFGNGGVHQITFVTGNSGKLREVRTCLEGHIAVEGIKIDLPELQCSSVLEVSMNKALAAYDLLKRPVLVEDTALCFEALGGMPGPYVKWFLDSIGAVGLIKLLSDFHSRRAYATCVFSYCTGPDAVMQFQGRCDGQIVNAPRGEGGFGWDCIFEPDESHGMTYAELPDVEKNKISHRAKALVSMLKHFLPSAVSS